MLFSPSARRRFMRTSRSEDAACVSADCDEDGLFNPDQKGTYKLTNIQRTDPDHQRTISDMISQL